MQSAAALRIAAVIAGMSLVVHASAATIDRPPPGNDCKVTLENKQDGVETYASVLGIPSAKNHIVCPFHPKSASTITIYFDSREKQCQSENLIGRRVKSVQLVAKANVDSEFTLCKAGSSSENAYFWIPIDSSEPYLRQQAVNALALHKAILFSGLPISNDVITNKGICFEIPASVDETPTQLFGAVGLKIPEWAKERMVRGKNCADALDTLVKQGR